MYLSYQTFFGVWRPYVTLFAYIQYSMKSQISVKGYKKLSCNFFLPSEFT